MVIFKSKQNKFEGDLKVRPCGKRLNTTKSIEYVGVKIDVNLNWQCQVNDISIKLKRANALLFKIRKYVSPKILRSIYFAIFESHLFYFSLVWALDFRTIQQIVILQTSLLELLISNQSLIKTNSILKLQEKICLEIILFVCKSVNSLKPSVFRWGTHLYMSLFLFVRLSICLSICCTAYLKNRTSSDHNFWYTYVKL